jgi:hypothetical protein
VKSQKDHPVRGVALFEVMVALALLTGAIVALAALFSTAARTNRLARVGSLTAILASQKMEQLRGLAWGYGLAGEEYTDLDTDISVWPEASGGSGLAESPGGTLSGNVAGFVDYLDQHGAWLGAGASPPSGAVYVRRWSVRTLPDSAHDTLILRVVVVLRGSEGRLTASSVLPLEAAQLTSLRSRRGP